MATFERLPGHDIRYPTADFKAVPARPVIPTAEYAAHIADSISKVADQLSPLGRATRAAELARAQYMQKLYSSGMLMGRNALIPHQIAYYDARTKAALAKIVPKPNQQYPDPTAMYRHYAAVVAAKRGTLGTGQSGTYSIPPVEHPQNPFGGDYASDFAQDLTKPAIDVTNTPAVESAVAGPSELPSETDY